jgi:diaminopropionate ammonia-lyase
VSHCNDGQPEDDGQAHTVTGNHETMMAGLACGEPNVQTWKILRDYAYGYISCSDSLSARGMKRLASPLGSDLKIVSGESGAVGIGLLERMMRDTGAAEIKSQLGLNKNSVVLIFNTEGDTDPDNYLRVING